MTLIFNKNGNGADELYRLTGSFPASNDFDSISSDLELETQTVVRFIGPEVYDRALKSYLEDCVDDSELIRLVQRPISLLATLRYLQNNLTDHDSSGRKVRVDSDSEKMAFEWMVERDDHARLQKAYKSLDILLSYLEHVKIPEWQSSSQNIQRQKLLVSTLEQFERVYYIDGSYRFFHILCPLMSEIQSQLFNGEVKEEVSDLARAAIILRTMSLALSRFSISVFPEGVVTRYSPSNQTIRASQSAGQDTIDRISKQLRTESDEYLSRISVKLNNSNNPYSEVDFKPLNSADNKFFSL